MLAKLHIWVKLNVFMFLSIATKKAAELEKVVLGNNDSNFFLDEVPVGVSGIQTKVLNDLALKLPAQQFLWIACQSHQPPSAKYLTSNIKWKCHLDKGKDTETENLSRWITRNDIIAGNGRILDTFT